MVIKTILLRRHRDGSAEDSAALTELILTKKTVVKLVARDDPYSPAWVCSTASINPKFRLDLQLLPTYENPAGPLNCMTDSHTLHRLTQLCVQITSKKLADALANVIQSARYLESLEIRLNQPTVNPKPQVTMENHTFVDDGNLARLKELRMPHGTVFSHSNIQQLEDAGALHFLTRLVAATYAHAASIGSKAPKLQQLQITHVQGPELIHFQGVLGEFAELRSLRLSGEKIQIPWGILRKIGMNLTELEFHEWEPLMEISPSREPVTPEAVHKIRRLCPSVERLGIDLSVKQCYFVDDNIAALTRFPRLAVLSLWIESRTFHHSQIKGNESEVARYAMSQFQRACSKFGSQLRVLRVYQGGALGHLRWRSTRDQKRERKRSAIYTFERDKAWKEQGTTYDFPEWTFSASYSAP